MRYKAKTLATVVAVSFGLGIIPSTHTSAARILSDCSQEGYYMASPENNIRSEISGESLGHLNSVQVYLLGDDKFIKDEQTGLTWIKINNAVVRENGKTVDGYICLSYCYYMGTTDNLRQYEVANTAPAFENFYSDSEVVEVLNEGDRLKLIDTGDTQLYCPRKKFWVNSCDLKANEDGAYYYSPYVDYSGMDFTYNEDAFHNENQKIIYMHFMAKGYPETSACAIAANAYSESGCNPMAWCNDTNGLISYGLFQHNGSRYERLKQWCAERRYDYRDIYAQLEYLDWELECYCTQVHDTMLDSSLTAGEASYYWASKFEVCSSRYWNKRATDAENLYYNVIANRITDTLVEGE